MSEKIVSISDLYEFKDNPYKVKDNEEMQDLIDSIKKYGIIEPLIVRKRDKGGYEIISGHRRKYACEKAGIKQVPVLIRDMDKNLAVITVVDSNLQRQDILPSEKAFAFKIKLDAERHQGKTSGQDVQKWTRENITDNMSGRQVQRYIRLTELIHGLLKLVDENKMAMSPAVEISYLKEREQKDLLETIESEECTPSYSQAIKMRELSKKNMLDMDTIFKIMTEQKPNQKERINLKYDKVKSYFPKGYSVEQMTEIIEKLLKNYQIQWQKKKQERISR